MILTETYTGLMTDPAHLGFELTLEALTGLVVYPLARRAVRRVADRLHADLDAEHGVAHDDAASPWDSRPARERPHHNVRVIR